MSDLTTEQLEAIREGRAPSSGSLRGTWSNAPKITKTQKVTAPSAIRISHENGELISINQVRGPSAQSVLAGQQRDEAERKEKAKLEAERLALLEDSSPAKTQARLAFLEREVKKLSKLVKELSNG